MTELKVDFCSYQAAKYAVEHWHYSKVMPMAKSVKFGVWEDGEYIGAVVFSIGANRNIGTPYNLKQTEAAELVRVALKNHKSFVSEVVSKAIKALKIQSPGLRLLVSYADPAQGHVGSIYQSMNWIYCGKTGVINVFKKNGKLIHKKSMWGKYGTNEASKVGGEWTSTEGKYKYLYPLDRAMRKQIAPLAQPYPKKIMLPVNGDNLATSQTGRFDPDPEALYNDKTVNNE